MINNKDLLDTRTKYVDLLKKELLGPGSEVSIPDEEHELISDKPYARYSIGILYPQDSQMQDGDKEEKTEDDDISDETPELEISENSDDDLTSVYLPDDEESSASEENQDNLDNEVNLSAQNKPSSMGITFFVKGNTEKIRCRIKFATYKKADSDDCRLPLSDECVENMQIPQQIGQYAYVDKSEKTLRLKSGGLDRKTINELKEKDLLEFDEYRLIDKLYKLAKQLHNGYVRDPHELEVDLKFNGRNYIDENTKLDGTALKVTSLRRNIREDIYSVTIMLVNDVSSKMVTTKLCIFQPKIMVLSDDNDFSYVDYTGGEDFAVLDDEEKSLALQYRNKKIYATGLGISTGWDINKGKGKIFSEFFPISEVPSMEFELEDKKAVPEKTFSMKYLSDLCTDDKYEKIEQLRALLDAYKRWICNIEKQSDKLEEKFKEISKKNIDGCIESAKRMEKGLQILADDTKAWDAFQLANRAIYMQRVHLKLQYQTSNIVRYPGDSELGSLLDNIDYYTADSIYRDKYSWRPFQLAFLVMSIDSIVNDDSDDRNLVDLIWFPTGGGKTEAYLGLTAFTIFYRRLAHKGVSDGTTVIMRYTLRLLAAQQFTRASTLICACEYIRCDATSRKPVYGKYDLGKKKITIGLWIGSEHTPNRNSDAKFKLNQLLGNDNSDLTYLKDRYNKFQVLKCPWCGTSLVRDNVGGEIKGIFGYQMRNNSHFEFFCNQEGCFFEAEDSLPIQVVDEELYLNPPTLLFGTVDKFAMLPWNSKIGNYFAVNNKNRAPELIIQDELHLISGPLGTMVGLYESAIDALCTKNGIKPKIIASTATIRRAFEQCAALYDRNVVQFPHPGINAEDSFFAREAKIDYKKEKFGRMYVGLMASGKSKAMMESRTIAALMQRINTMDIEDEIKDKFWTLTVYFNSLKDLGKCVTLVNDDVRRYINTTATRIKEQKDARFIGMADELTSRVSTTKLNETLDKLEKCCYNKENIENKRWPSNILLATNMISVGIDVPRLNVMLMVGQPKLTSEYIQASSRVGRQYPGVVFTMYDSSKSRDRSHYEQFKGYHDSFYKYVEPTGVTPFSRPARERALHAVVISLLRQLVPNLSEEKMAGNFNRNDFKAEIEQISSYIIDRSNNVNKRITPQADSDEDNIREEIAYILEKWERLAEGAEIGGLLYGERFMVKPPADGESRLIKAFNTSINDEAFETMTSVRNIDTMIAGSIIIWES